MQVKREWFALAAQPFHPTFNLYCRSLSWENLKCQGGECSEQSMCTPPCALSVSAYIDTHALNGVVGRGKDRYY